MMNVRNLTRLSQTIHLIGMLAIGVSLGILLETHIENYRVIASMGFTMLGTLLILASISFDQKA